MPIKKWTTENVKKFVEENSECKLISEYRGWDIKIKLLCKCGEEFDVLFNNFKQGQRQCNNCSKIKRLKKVKTSYNEIKSEIESISNCKLLTSEEEFNYEVEVNKKPPTEVKLKLLCGQCNKEVFYRNLNNLRSFKRYYCYSCFITNKRSKLYESVKHFIEVESQSGCKLISSTYLGGNEKLKIQCPCGNYFNVTFNKFKYGNKRTCNECSEKIRRQKIATHSYEDVLEYIESKGCILLVNKKNYINAKQPLWVIGTCNHMLQISFVDFKKRKSYICTDCLKTEWDIKRIREWFKTNLPGYKLKSRKYKDQQTKLKIYCPQGHYFEKSWNHILRGELCPVCSSSGGAQLIHDYLQRNKIDFKREFRFDDCKNEKPLPFDFAVFKDGELKCLIEFDGRQHFEPVDFGDMTKEEAEIAFKERQRNDRIKNEYCKKNKIKLIRIPYWDFNKIEQILDKKLIEVKGYAFNIK